MGPRGARAYGLRPRLWLLVVLSEESTVQLLRILGIEQVITCILKINTYRL